MCIYKVVYTKVVSTVANKIADIGLIGFFCESLDLSESYHVLLKRPHDLCANTKTH